MTSQKDQPNRFDNLKVDVGQLYKNYPNSSFEHPSKSIFGIFYHNPLPLSIRSLVWYVFHRIHLDQEWFFDFKKYWKFMLGGITLWGPEDFYFLRNTYRLKFQHSKMSSKTTTEGHLASWQQPEILYQLLDMVYRESLFNQVPAIELFLKYRKTENRTLYEFGCGTAPVARSCVDFFGSSNFKLYISDIQTIFFHYACFRFRKNSRVIPQELTPSTDFMPRVPEKVGAIFCMTVYEHLPQPLKVTKEFYKLLDHGGVLIFDYLKSEGKGMDTKSALNERDKVLHYIKSNFEIVHGAFSDSDEAKTIVARKI